MGFSESDSTNCRRHPNPRQLPGICSSCLREKLSNLSNSSSFNNTRKSTTFISYSSSFASSPPYSTASSTSTTTTTTTTTATTRKSPGSRHRRNGSEAYVSVGMVLNNGLKKSRSVSCAPLSKHSKIDCVNYSEKIIGGKIKNNLIGGKILEEDDGKNLRKKNGFLKKLIHSTSKKTKGVLLTHSKTVKERSSSHHNSSSTVAAITKQFS
ncbi:uncharacterized protein [Spinacia oleracea]|uniref:Uncharacterized protein n=1 Tax=Spinacia oleracea TaxID=3562 RepID=A0A9R0JZN2_SPIOL|nr:uncharacterized protein LOC110791850 [Spinacia oleracea]